MNLVAQMRTCIKCKRTLRALSRHFSWQRQLRFDGSQRINLRTDCRVCHNEVTRIRSAERQARRVANRLSPEEELEVLKENFNGSYHELYRLLSIHARHILIMRMWKSGRYSSCTRLGVELGLHARTIRYHINKDIAGEPSGTRIRHRQDA